MSKRSDPEDPQVTESEDESNPAATPNRTNLALHASQSIEQSAYFQPDSNKPSEFNQASLEEGEVQMSRMFDGLNIAEELKEAPKLDK